MFTPSLRPGRVILLALALSLPSGNAFSQENPNRPPWAQKSKPKANSTSTANSGANAPEAAPVGEPGKIVQPTPPPPKEDSQDAAAQRGRIRVNVNLVSVLVSVLDERNRPAPDLPREAFQLFDEGKQQEIAIFEPETSLPLDLALMIDASLSAHKEISFEQEAAAHFIRQVIRPGDRSARVSPTMSQPFRTPSAGFPMARALLSTMRCFWPRARSPSAEMTGAA